MTTRAGEVYENPVTGERAVIRVGTEESGGELLVNDLYVRPGGAVMGEHVHPNIEESFTVVRGRLGYRLDGREGVAKPGERLHVPRGTTHDWWNVGEEEAQVLVEISPAARFEEMILNAFGLAQDGKTNAKGQPRLLRAAGDPQGGLMEHDVDSVGQPIQQRLIADVALDHAHVADRLGRREVRVAPA